MQSPPFPRYLVSPRSNYSPQHHILKHPQLPFLPQSSSLITDISFKRCATISCSGKDLYQDHICNSKNPLNLELHSPTSQEVIQHFLSRTRTLWSTLIERFRKWTVYLPNRTDACGVCSTGSSCLPCVRVATVDCSVMCLAVHLPSAVQYICWAHDRQNSKIKTDRKLAVIAMCMHSSEIKLWYRNHRQK